MSASTDQQAGAAQEQRGRRGRLPSAILVLGVAGLVAAVLLAVLAVMSGRGSLSGGAGDDVGGEEVVIHVSAHGPAAEEEGRGTPDQPLSDLGAAVDLAVAANRAGTPARLVLAPGLYRDSLRLPGEEQGTAAPLVIEGHGAVLTGADPLVDATVDGDELVFDWAHDWGVADLPASWESFWEENDIGDVVLRREIVIADGRILRQVVEDADLEPGTYWVDEDADELRVVLPDGADVDSVRLEAAVRGVAFDSGGWDGLTVRGLTVRHAATPFQGAGFVIAGSSEVLIEDVQAQGNSWAGISIRESDGVVVRRTRANDNGIMGFAVYRVTDAQLHDVENSSNNWRGPWGGYYTWEAGSKFLATRDVQIHGWRGVANASHGLWIDYDNQDLVIDGAYLAGNRGHGLFLEANPGPLEVRDVIACGNTRAGIVEAGSQHVTTVGVVLFDNAEGQLVFSGEVPGRSVTSWDTGEERLVSTDTWSLQRSTLVARGDQPVIGTTLPQDDWDQMTSTLTTSDNRFAAPRDDAFVIPEEQEVGLEEWAEAAGQESAGRFEDLDALGCDLVP